MTTTLQQALLKAGLVNKDQLKKSEQEKKKNHGQPRRAAPEKKKSVGFIEGKHHHHLRTDCEGCGKSSPDVEYYQHKNRSLEKYWLCVRCADAHNIPDVTRQTVQSQFAQTGRFRREYGATKVFK